ncbi:MAG: hypothetical protein HUJ31_06440 [Pseudomonadales bacterium]|nr:hypothetical protein [Pseudomonadales bacterium]
MGPQGLTGPAGPAGPEGPAGAPGANGIDGLHCWDLNGDGLADAAEDRNNDGVHDAKDCQGASSGGGSSLTVVDLSVDTSIVDAAPQSVGQLVFDTSSNVMIIGVGTDSIGDWQIISQRSSPYHFISGPILEKVEAWIGEGPKQFEVCYDRAIHGATSSAFHNLCDNQGPTVTMIRMTDGTTIGGYNSNSWSSASTYLYSDRNFLFSIDKDEKYDVRYPQYSTYNRSDYGPTFGGGHDIFIQANMTNGYCNPHSYLGQDRYAFCGSYNGWSIERLIVFKVISP